MPAHKSMPRIAAFNSSYLVVTDKLLAVDLILSFNAEVIVIIGERYIRLYAVIPMNVFRQDQVKAQTNARPERS